jgi:DNA polymerase elongation subunit (family B)
VNNTLYGVFAADHQRYFGPHSENITLIGQALTGVVEDIASRAGGLVRRVIYGDTDSVMLELDDPDDPVEAARQVAHEIEAEMQEWAEGLGAMSEYLTLDVDDVYDRFYIGDKKKRYFGHRIWTDGEEADDVKVRGFEYRQHSVPEPVREFQYDLMLAKLDGEPTGPIIDEYRDRLYSGEWDLEMATSKSLNKPVSEYAGPTPPVHVRAAEAIREEFGGSAIDVGSKVGYVKYGPETHQWTWVHEGEMGRGLNPHHYEYLWRERFVSAMEAIGVQEHEQAGLGAFS